MFRSLVVSAALIYSANGLATTGPSVIVSPVEESSGAPPVQVNGLVRSKSDVLLPARVSGQITWSLEEGARVSKGDVLAQVNRKRLELSLLEQALMAERADVNIRYLQGEVARLHELEKKNLAAKTQLAEMTSRRDLAANDLSLVKARIAQIENDLEETRIVSPIDGLIVERRIETGEYARAGDTVIRVVDTDSLEVTAAVPVANLNRINFKEGVLVSVDNLSFKTDLTSVIHAGDQRSQTFDVIIDVPRAVATNMVVGQFVGVDVPLKTSKRLFVPRDAVVLRSDGSYVFRISEENVAQRVNVELGKGHGSMVSVLTEKGTLKIGDRVAVRGVESLKDGQAVSPAAS